MYLVSVISDHRNADVPDFVELHTTTQYTVPPPMLYSRYIIRKFWKLCNFLKFNKLWFLSCWQYSEFETIERHNRSYTDCCSLVLHLPILNVRCLFSENKEEPTTTTTSLPATLPPTTDEFSLLVVLIVGLVLLLWLLAVLIWCLKRRTCIGKMVEMSIKCNFVRVEFRYN